MKALIGVETLRKLPVGPVDIRDTKLRGFVLRVRPSGVHTYFANYARGKWKVLGTTQVLTPPEAREEARQVLGYAMKGGDPIAEAKATAEAEPGTSRLPRSSRSTTRLGRRRKGKPEPSR